jgi:hypothetical protein
MNTTDNKSNGGERQTLIPDIPGRSIPDKRLEPKRKQTEKPTLLEMFEDEIKQRGEP